MADTVAIFRVEPHPANIRASLGDLAELAASIRAQGILQPIVVQPHPRKHGHYIVLGGHRRLAAAKLAGLDEVPVTVREAAGPAKALEVMLVENVQRADIGPMDKAEAMGRLLKMGCTQADICRATGLTSATVSTYVSLLELDKAARDRLRAGELSAADAITAVRSYRARRRKRNGTPQVGAIWEPDYLTGTHPLAARARAMCEAREHTQRRRIGKTACGQCWETVIRQDEQLVTRTLRAVPDEVMAP